MGIKDRALKIVKFSGEKLLSLLHKVYEHRYTYLAWLKRAAYVTRKIFELIFYICTYNRKTTFASVTILLIIALTTLTPMRCSDNGSVVLRRNSINSYISNSMSESDATKVLDSSIEAFIRKWGLAGASFAIMRNDSLLYAKGYGYADKEREIKLDASNTLRIASASKLLTAAAVMKLVEQNKLTLTSKVFGEDGILCDTTLLDIRDRNLKLITVEHLLRHTSGIKTPISDPAFASYSVAKSLGKELPLSTNDMVKYAIQHRLRARPGEMYSYSNLGYIILGKIIEKVSGESYVDYLTTEVLDPAGCHNIYIGENYQKDRAKNEVKYYEVKEAELFDAYDGSGKQVLKSNGGNDIQVLSSAGGLVASAPELLRFVASINGSGVKRDVLSKESVSTMTFDSKDRRKKPMGWASVRGNEWLRSGSMSGTCTLIKHQSNGYTWVFISNSSAWIAYHLTNHISTQISRAVSRVKEWPKQDLFTLAGEESVTEK